MKKEDRKKLIDYWRKTAAHDYDTMQSLFTSKRYDASLFFGHIVLEKILKALAVKTTGEHAPYTHDLLRLAKISQIALSSQDVELLDEVNDFNMEARYPENKMDFYKKCTRGYTKKYFEAIVILYEELCRQLKSKK